MHHPTPNAAPSGGASAVVLAAGADDESRALLTSALGDATVVELALANARALLPADRIVVVAQGDTEIRALLGDDLTYVEQDARLGTGHALTCARAAIPATGPRSRRSTTRSASSRASTRYQGERAIFSHPNAWPIIVEVMLGCRLDHGRRCRPGPDGSDPGRSGRLGRQGRGRPRLTFHRRPARRPAGARRTGRRWNVSRGRPRP